MKKAIFCPDRRTLIDDTGTLCARLNRRNCVAMCLLDLRRNHWKITGEYSVTAKSVNPYNNQFPVLVKDLKSWKHAGYQMILVCPSTDKSAADGGGSAGRRTAGILQRGSGPVLKTRRDHADLMEMSAVDFEYPMQKFVLITESDIFGKERRKDAEKIPVFRSEDSELFRTVHWRLCGSRKSRTWYLQRN